MMYPGGVFGGTRRKKKVYERKQSRGSPDNRDAAANPLRNGSGFVGPNPAAAHCLSTKPILGMVQWPIVVLPSRRAGVSRGPHDSYLFCEASAARSPGAMKSFEWIQVPLSETLSTLDPGDKS